MEQCYSKEECKCLIANATGLQYSNDRPYLWNMFPAGYLEFAPASDGDGVRIEQFFLHSGNGLNDLLAVLAKKEKRALGRVKHGKCEEKVEV